MVSIKFTVIYYIDLTCLSFLALHDFATNIYSRELFISMLVKPLLLTLNSCSKFSVDEDKVSHFDPARKAVPVIVAVLSWLHAMANEMGLAEPQGKDNYDLLLFLYRYHITNTAKSPHMQTSILMAFQLSIQRLCLMIYTV